MTERHIHQRLTDFRSNRGQFGRHDIVFGRIDTMTTEQIGGELPMLYRNALCQRCTSYAALNIDVFGDQYVDAIRFDVDVRVNPAQLLLK